ncbi:MAG: rRNA maturation RNase YbeY [Chromatiales bacterium]
MSVELELQVATRSEGVPPESDLRRWAEAALGTQRRGGLVIRVVGEEEMRALNRDYRGKDRPTNVLSFAFEAPPGVPVDHLGDIAICAPVVAREAREQGKRLGAHWAHMVVHGILHLLGHDHQNDSDAIAMESLEAAILGRLGLPDPYKDAESDE